eukprot:1138316-Pelagomonas_calceolata.AAC.5
MLSPTSCAAVQSPIRAMHSPTSLCGGNTACAQGWMLSCVATQHAFRSGCYHACSSLRGAC